MSREDYLNLSTDLRRISQWLTEGQDDMVEIFMPRLLIKFKNDDNVVGKKAVGKWLDEINNYRRHRGEAAERALTLSSILL